MSSANTRRQALWRRRRREGKSCFLLELDEVNIELMLEAGGLLPAGVEIAGKRSPGRCNCRSNCWRA
jgi:hypothetical protein